MKNNTSTQARLDGLPDFQKRAAEALLAQSNPVKPVPSVFRQWLAWLALAVSGMVFTFTVLHPQPELLERLTQFPTGPFLALVFLASAVAAWLGIASSIPGEEPRPALKALMGALLLCLFAMPIFFFTPDHLKDVLDHNRISEWFCFRTVVVVAAPSWVLLGWMAARNASFRPGWTGGWLAVSAFLLGSGSIQTHCHHWECWHVVVNHLMPLTVFIFIPILIGSYWFSRWNRSR